MMTQVTNDQMLLMTLNHWEKQNKKKYKKNQQFLEQEARAAVNLTRQEMEAIKKVVPGMTDWEAWTEARTLFCITPMPTNPEEE